MFQSRDQEQSSNILLLDHFYRTFFVVCVVFLAIGVPFVFHRKAVSAVMCVATMAAVLAAWRMSRRGQPQKSLMLFASGLWLILVGLLFGGLPPVTAATTLAVAVMLTVVVNFRAGSLFGGSYLLAWLLYVVLQANQLAPEPYFPGNPLTSWLIGAVAIWLVLLPIPALVRKLRRSASLQRAVIEAASDGILVVDLEGKVETFNQRFMALWRIPVELQHVQDDAALLDCVMQQLRDPEQFMHVVKDLYARPERSSFDTLHFKDGRVFERQSQPEQLGAEIVGRVWSFRDVSERQRTQLALQHGKQQFEAILNATTESVFLVDRAGLILAVNDTAARRLHQNAAQLLGQCVFGFFPAEVAATRRASLEQVFVTGRGGYVEDSRGERHFGLNYYPVPDGDAGVSSVVVFAADITERKQAQAQLVEREARLSSLLLAMQDPVVVLDASAAVVECFCPHGTGHPSFQSADGLVLGRRCPDLMPEAAAKMYLAAIAALCADAGPQTFDYAVRHDGQDYFYAATMSRIGGTSTGADEFLTVVRDVTARRTARLEIERLGQRNALLLESVGEGIFDVDLNGKTTFANPAALSLLGLTEAQMLGQDQHWLFHHHREDGSPYPLVQCPIYEVLQDGQRRQLESEWFWRQDGTGFAVSMVVTPIVVEGQRMGVVVVFQDITQRRRAHAEIHRLAFHDALTLLPNRRLLNDRLGQQIAVCKRDDLHGTLLFLDLDNFKPLNDAQGHSVGDSLLVEVARRITQCVREVDTVARFGGDEFVVMLGQLEGEEAAARQHAASVAEKVRQALAQPYHLVVPQDDGADTHVQHRCTSSIGIAFFGRQTSSVDDVLKCADAAMYQAKQAGRNAVCCYEPALG